MKLIDKDAVVAKIDNILDYIDEHWDTDYAIGAQRFADKLQDAINTLEVKEVDLELIVGWFNHIAQMADDRKTLNGEVMEDWAALDEIKCLAKNSSEFIQRHCKAQKGEL